MFASSARHEQGWFSALRENGLLALSQVYKGAILAAYPSEGARISKSIVAIKEYADHETEGGCKSGMITRQIPDEIQMTVITGREPGKQP